MLFDQIQEEDMRNMAPMHASLASGVLKGIPINYQERRIYHYHEELDRRIGRNRVPEVRNRQEPPPCVRVPMRLFFGP